jgi:hypothetical protein
VTDRQTDTSVQVLEGFEDLARFRTSSCFCRHRQTDTHVAFIYTIMEGMVPLVSGNGYLSFCQGAAVCTELISLSECKVTSGEGTSAVDQVMQTVLN